MSITFEDLEPALEKEFADADVSEELAPKLVSAFWRALLSTQEAREQGADLVLEDRSGRVVLLQVKSKAASDALERFEESGEPLLFSGAVAAAIAEAMKGWSRQAGSYREVLAALTPKDRGPLAAAALLQARRNAAARQQFLDEFPSLNSAEVADAAMSKASNRASLANRWRDEGKVFAIRVGDQQLYPAFQLDEQGRPLDVIASILDTLRPGHLSDWQIALWMTSPTGWLGGRRPVELLADEPSLALEAAEREVGELVA
jgi:hypothetical protein